MGRKIRRKRDRKHKAKRPDRRGERVSLAYHGNKYKTKELVEVHFHAEIGIYESFVMTGRRLTDRAVASALEKLILRMRTRALQDWEDTSTVSHGEGGEEDLVIWSVRRNWQDLFNRRPRPSQENLIGVLRTILGSVEIWRSASPTSRSYLRYIEGFLTEMGVSVKEYSPDSQPVEAPEEEGLLLIGRAWCHEDDPEAGCAFQERAEFMLQSGQAEEVVEVCQQLIGEATGSDRVPELSALSIRAQQSLRVSMG